MIIKDISRKILKQSIVLVLVSLCLILPITTNASAISSDDNDVDCVIGTTVASELKQNINNNIADGNVDFNNSYEVHDVVIPTFMISDIDNVTEQILEKEATKAYCLVYNDIVYYTNETKTGVEQYIEDLEKYAIKKYGEGYFLMDRNYQIKETYFLHCRQYSFDQMINIFKIKIYSKEDKVIAEPIPFKTKIIYSEGDSKVIKEGKKGVMKKYYSEYLLNDKVIESTLMSTEITKKPVTKIITSNNIKDFPYKENKNNAEILGLDKQKTEFINEILPIAKSAAKKYNIPPSLTIAQAILESDWGKCPIGNNLYGIKAYADWKGKTQYVYTKEQKKNGKYITIKTYFRDYDSIQDSVKDYIRLMNTDNYALIRESVTYIDACKAVKECKYATSLNYTNNLINLIEQYKLYSWDRIPYKITNGMQER